MYYFQICADIKILASQEIGCDYRKDNINQADNDCDEFRWDTLIHLNCMPAITNNMNNEQDYWTCNGDYIYSSHF